MTSWRRGIASGDHKVNICRILELYFFLSLITLKQVQSFKASAHLEIQHFPELLRVGLLEYSLDLLLESQMVAILM